MPTPPPTRRRRAPALAAVAIAAVVAVGCSSDGRTLAPSRPDQTLSILTTTTTTPPVEVPVDFVLYAPWEAGTSIPIDQSCDGAGRAPSLTWAGVPFGTTELALVVTDLDAQDRVHWVLAGIDPAVVTSVTPGALPPGAIEGNNSGGTVGFEPLCPPVGEPAHRYTVELYALGSPSGVTAQLTATDAVASVQGAALATASVVGTYQR